MIKNIDLNKISTEGRNPKSLNIDKEDSLGIIQIINDSDKQVAIAIENELLKISELIDTAYSVVENGGRIIYIGAGTSGRLGVLDASEMPPTYGVSNAFVGIIAGGDQALRNALENIEDSKEAAIEDLKKIDICEKDMLIGIAASGRTPYVISALEYAREIGAKTGSLSTSVNTEISKLADHSIEIDVGPEVVTGSTRMKSGSAQKMVLNMISTATMIKWGKVYQNLMVDVKTSNEKLRKRAIQIVSEATGADEKLASQKLDEANQSAKVAIVMIWKDVSVNEAIQLIDDAKGKIGEI